MKTIKPNARLKDLLPKPPKRLSCKKASKIFMAVLALCLGKYAVDSINDNLPNPDEVNAFYSEVGADTCYNTVHLTDKFKLSTNTRARVPDGKINLNVNIDNLSEEQKQEFIKVTDDLNDIFSVVNPDYKFGVNFNPSVLDNLDPDNVNFSMKLISNDNTSSGEWFGIVWFLNNTSFEPRFACVKLSSKNSINYYTIMHEMCHHLGLGDAYLVPDKVKCDTIMNVSQFLRENDIALLAAKYGDYSTPEKKAKLVDFIRNYEKNQQWHEYIVDKTDDMIDCITKEFNVAEKDIDFNLEGKALYNGISDRPQEDENVFYSYAQKGIFNKNDLTYNQLEARSYFKENHDYYSELKEVEASFKLENIDNKKIRIDRENQVELYFAIGDEIYSIVNVNVNNDKEELKITRRGKAIDEETANKNYEDAKNKLTELEKIEASGTSKALSNFLLENHFHYLKDIEEYAEIPYDSIENLNLRSYWVGYKLKFTPDDVLVSESDKEDVVADYYFIDKGIFIPKCHGILIRLGNEKDEYEYYKYDENGYVKYKIGDYYIVKEEEQE